MSPCSVTRVIDVVSPQPSRLNIVNGSRRPGHPGGMSRLDTAVAECAGLTYVTDSDPGITRERVEDGWISRRPDGSLLCGDDRAWIDALGIPPAWTDVWISPR